MTNTDPTTEQHYAAIVATPKETGLEHLYLVREHNDGQSIIKPLDLDGYARFPRIDPEEVNVSSAADLLRYLDRKADPGETEIFVKEHWEGGFQAVAYVPAHEGQAPGQCGVTVCARPTPSSDWKDWRRTCGTELSQLDLIKFLREQAHNIGDTELWLLLERIETVCVTSNRVTVSTVARAGGKVENESSEETLMGSSVAVGGDFPEKFAIEIKPYERIESTCRIQVNLKWDISDKDRPTFALYPDGMRNADWHAFKEWAKPLTEQDKWLVFGLD